MISYKEDPLFENKNKNIYRCLVNPKKDLNDRNFCLRTPTITLINKNRIIELIKKKYGTFNQGFLFSIKQLEKYTKLKFSSVYKTKYRYLQLFKKNQANIVFLRVISLCLSNDSGESIKLFESFTIKNSYTAISKLKLKVSGFGKRISYLIGVTSGDGHLNRTETGLIIVDGQSDKNKCLYSKKYLKFLNTLFKKEFNLEGKMVKQRTWWVYSIHNKWLCRFINHYFEIPFGKKSDIIKLPESLRGLNERYFWRGIMDTDGFVNKKNKAISLKSNSLTLMKQFKNFCIKNNIQVWTKKEKRGYSLNIFSCSILNYANLIGFSHPRKKELLLKHLKKGIKYKVLKKINQDLPPEFSRIFRFLRPYKESVYIKLSEHHRKAKRHDVNNLLNLIRTILEVKITEVKINRRNNHFVIRSKKFTEFVKNNAIYDLPWHPLNSYEIKKLLKAWNL